MGKTQDMWSNKTWKRQCKQEKIYKKMLGESEKIRPYYCKFHRGLLWVYLALVSLLCILFIPWALNLVTRSFATQSWFTEDIVAIEESSEDKKSENGKEDSAENTQEQDKNDVTHEDADSSSGKGETKDSSIKESITGLQLLPDFLGGMAGILVGFILDFWFIDRLKTIRQYEAMLNPLDREFKKIKKECDRRCERQEKGIKDICGFSDEKKIERIKKDFAGYNPTYKNTYLLAIKKINGIIANPKNLSGEKDERLLAIIKQTEPINIPEDNEMSQDMYYQLIEVFNGWYCYDWQISRPVLDDIVSDYENSAVVSHLPRYLLGTKRYSVSDTLFDIDRKCEEYNEQINAMDRRAQLYCYLSRKEFQKIRNAIDAFYLKTAVWKRNKDLAQTLQEDIITHSKEHTAR